jgi:hypothetical protein
MPRLARAARATSRTHRQSRSNYSVADGGQISVFPGLSLRHLNLDPHLCFSGCSGRNSAASFVCAAFVIYRHRLERAGAVIFSLRVRRTLLEPKRFLFRLACRIPRLYYEGHTSSLPHVSRQIRDRRVAQTQISDVCRRFDREAKRRDDASAWDRVRLSADFGKRGANGISDDIIEF